MSELFEDELNQFNTDEEKLSFIDGRLAISRMGMSKKIKEKWEQLRGEMLKYTMSKNSMPPLNYNAMPMPNFNGFDAMPQGRNSIVVFFGFNGMLSQKYSVVDGMGREEITARLQFAGDKVPYSIKRYDDFMVVVDQMRDTPNMLKEIPFDDAMNIIRIGIGKLQVEEYEDAEEDEFDDNCKETCKPGDHKCGKK